MIISIDEMHETVRQGINLIYKQAKLIEAQKVYIGYLERELGKYKLHEDMRRQAAE